MHWQPLWRGPSVLRILYATDLSSASASGEALVGHLLRPGRSIVDIVHVPPLAEPRARVELWTELDRCLWTTDASNRYMYVYGAATWTIKATNLVTGQGGTTVACSVGTPVVSPPGSSDTTSQSSTGGGKIATGGGRRAAIVPKRLSIRI